MSDQTCETCANSNGNFACCSCKAPEGNIHWSPRQDNQAECRNAFEKWADGKLDLDRMANGGKYALSSTEIIWFAYQDAWNESKNAN